MGRKRINRVELRSLETLQPTPAIVARLLRAYGWKRFRRYTSSTGSRYIAGTQGYKRVLIRFSDHKQPVRVQKKRRTVTFDFCPGSTVTLRDLQLFLVDVTRTPEADG